MRFAGLFWKGRDLMKLINGKRMVSFMLTFMLIISLFPISTLQTFAAQIDSKSTCSGGSGTAADPYLISNTEDLYSFTNLVNSGNFSICAKLTNNIVVNENVLNENGTLNESSSLIEWTPIGKTYRYKGTFDGNNFTISGLYVNSKSSYASFINFASNITVKNLGIVDSYFYSANGASSICANATYSQFDNCYSNSTVVSTPTNYNTSFSSCTGVGGICGDSFHSNILNSNFSGKVSGYGNVGGICGISQHSRINNCYNNGTVQATGNVGGLVGYSLNNGNYNNSYNKGNVFGDSFVGGLVGLSSYGILINNCSNSGNITGNFHTGGLAGYICCKQDYANDINGSDDYFDEYPIKISNSYNEGNVNGQERTGGLVGSLSIGLINNCFNLGDLSNSYAYCGGLVGATINDSIISTSYTVGKINATGSNVGGLVGCNYDNITIKNCYSFSEISGCDTYSGICGADLENNCIIENCFYLGDEENDNYDSTTAKPKNSFLTGEVTYLLNGESSDGDLIWYQTLDKDEYPVLNGGVIYKGYKNCASTELEYANSPLLDEIPAHNYVDGTCTGCGRAESVYIIGDIELTLLPTKNGFYEGSLNLEEGVYNFKIKENNIELGGAHKFRNTTNAIVYSNEWSSATEFFVSGGKYTFSFDTNTNRLAITSKLNEALVELYNKETGLSIPLEKTSENIFAGLFEHEAGAFSFRINDGGITKCFGYTFTDSFQNVTYNADWKSATTLKMTGGIYSIKYDRSTDTLSISHTIPDENKVRIFGEVELDLNKESENEYSGSIFLNQGTYAFRIEEFSTVYCNGDTLSDTVSDLSYNKYWTKPTILNTTGGKYTFKYSTQTHKITIYHASTQTDKISIQSNYFKEITLLKQGDSNIYAKTVSFTEGTYKFRVDEFGARLCNGSTFVNSVINMNYRYDWKNDTTFKVTRDYEGDFEIKYDYDKKTLWIAPVNK